MIYQRLCEVFNNASDLKEKVTGKVHVVFLESLCSSNKLNEYVLKNISLIKKYKSLKDNVSGPNITFIKNEDEIPFYLLNGYALVYDGKEMLVCEVKADLYRGVSEPSSEASVNGPKDSFNESILLNLGLIKRRIKSNDLCNEDFFLGNKTKTKTSLLYIKGIAKEKFIKKIRKKLENISIDGIIDIELLHKSLEEKDSPLPTVAKTERPDLVATSLLEGKIVIIADNSPYALILPSFFADFINPQGDNYVKALNVNLLKIIRFLALLITITLPALYIAIVNYNQKSVPQQLLLSFQSARSGVPFPSAFEAVFMIFLCAILRESDIRFPSSYGSSISVLGALFLGEAAVSASIVSPIMIIVIGITFVTGLVFNNGEMISGLRLYRLIILLFAVIFGLYGFVIGMFLLLLHLSGIESLDEAYLYPISPFDKVYFFKTLLSKNKNLKRSKVLSNNRTRGSE